MKQIDCPNCSSVYSEENPPKKLKNCEHTMCQCCLPVVPKCPIDNRRVQYRRYTANAFQIDQELLDSILQKEKNIQTRANDPNNQKTETIDFEICLLHSKPADLICFDDGKMICASCALFGEHKGHSVKNSDDFLQQLTSFTEQALSSFDQLKQSEENLSGEIVVNYIDDEFKQMRIKELKSIKAGFNKLIQKIRKAEKAVIADLDKSIKQKKQSILKEISIQELQSRKHEWYAQTEQLGQITQQAYNFRRIPEAIKYVDGNSSQSFLLKRGEYLQLEFSTNQNMIKKKIDKEVSSLTACFNQTAFQAGLSEYCYFGEPLAKISSPSQKQDNSRGAIPSQRNYDCLLQTQNSPCKYGSSNNTNSGNAAKKFGELGMSSNDKKAEQKTSFDNATEGTKSVSSFSMNYIDCEISQSIKPVSTNAFEQSHHRKNNERNRSKSRKRSENSIVNYVNARSILSSMDGNNGRKKKKMDIPQKYKQVFEDLKNDRCEVIDFGGAELGDSNIQGLCEYIEKTTKLRNLKLVRNKITDEMMKELLNACFCSKVTSLNLGQNSLTEKSLELLEQYDLGELRNITLSLNKVNRRNVKNRLEQFVRRGITLSI